MSEMQKNSFMDHVCSAYTAEYKFKPHIIYEFYNNTLFD